MGRFIIIWVLIALLVYTYRYILTMGGRQSTKLQIKNILVSFSISTAVVTVLYLFNNVQGL